ncbi:hypothetical protein BU25DRAFT_423722 [Macroventuria anomochaeta]|uniref:Uncharacterized protein n=1 Tax=Macroventuria anomochaeta TaxID=301207 RepID=A0ACB6RVP7_9PLEO|nr:uncharacterized protein BU25DRAFT_423722 [Macroventuria anomochaeta]KAF2624967.1 hypothetical protein BU25DRAFT_423722 [Macroventuria anomochaeta]
MSSCASLPRRPVDNIATPTRSDSHSRLFHGFPALSPALYPAFTSSYPKSDSRILNMPSRVFAAPPRQVEELTALLTHRDKENFASPILAEGECSFELALDFQGRKHVYPEASVEVYTFGLQEDVSSSHPSFPMPGLASANTLRNYLHEYLQPHQIIDEYGDECDLSGVSNDHLAVLQAKMWTKVSNSRCPTMTTSQRPSRLQVLVAEHVAKISQLLEEKHLFVLSNTAHDTCTYLKDLQVIPMHTCQSQIVRLEPLVHWGTVTPTVGSQSILAFRRDGELMQQPEYWQLVRHLVDTEAPTYCVDCLEYLWRKRAEARDTMRQLQGALPRPQLRSSEEPAPVQIMRPFKNPRVTLFDVSALIGSGTLGAAAYQSKPADGELHEDFGKVSQDAPTLRKTDETG